MKRSLIVLVLAFSCAGIAFTWKHLARASVIEPPAKMDLLKAAKLDAALVRINMIDARAEMDKQPLYVTVKAICDEYKIDPRLFFQRDSGLSVNTETGEITRPKVASK